MRINSEALQHAPLNVTLLFTASWQEFFRRADNAGREITIIPIHMLPVSVTEVSSFHTGQTWWEGAYRSFARVRKQDSLSAMSKCYTLLLDYFRTHSLRACHIQHHRKMKASADIHYQKLCAKSDKVRELTNCLPKLDVTCMYVLLRGTSSNVI
jgi:hypothetical protein